MRLTRAASGDQDALSQLLGQVAPELRRRLHGTIATHWKSVLDEDDILQVTFLEAFLRIGSFEVRAGAPMQDFVAWLTLIAKNNVRDAVRGLEACKRPDPRQRVRSAAGGGESHVSLMERLGVGTSTPSRHAAQHEAVSLLERCLPGLPSDYERVLRLYDLEGKPIEDVARELGRSPRATHMLRARAHDRLREALGAASRFFTHAP